MNSSFQWLKEISKCDYSGLTNRKLKKHPLIWVFFFA